MITLDRLTYSYRRGTKAIDAACGHISPGIHLLLGENGAGKTTLLHCMAGLFRPGSGRCLLDGTETASHAPSVMRRLFFLPDKLEIPATSIRAFAKTHSRFYPGFSPEALDANLREFGLDGTEDLSKSSLGTNRKTFIAYALALGVDMLLLDEPANGLDIGSKKAMRRMMARCVEPDQTVIVSTHNISDLRELYDGLMLIHNGSLKICASTEEIASRLACVRSTAPVPDALYSEQSVGVVSSLIENTSGDPGDIDYSLLYSALIDNGDNILSILNRPN